MDTLEYHEAANITPLLTGQQYEKFRADIKQRGLQQPIVLYEGKILDGRNRYRACKAEGLLFETVQWENGGDPIEYVKSANLHRLHLKTSQRAMVAARIRKYHDKQAEKRMLAGKKQDPVENLPQGQGKARDQAGAVVKVSGRSVDSATRVLDMGVPELIEAVDRGDLAVSRAAEIAKLPKARQEECVKRGELGRRPPHTPGMRNGSWDRRTYGPVKHTTLAKIRANLEESQKLMDRPAREVLVLRVRECVKEALLHMDTIVANQKGTKTCSKS